MGSPDKLTAFRRVFNVGATVLILSSFGLWTKPEANPVSSRTPPESSDHSRTSALEPPVIFTPRQPTPFPTPTLKEAPKNDEVLRKIGPTELIGSSTIKRMETTGLSNLFPKIESLRAHALSGATIKDLTAIVESLPANTETENVVFYSGINDIVFQKMTAGETYQQFLVMVKHARVKFPNANIFAATSLPNMMATNQQDGDERKRIVTEQDLLKKMFKEGQGLNDYLVIDTDELRLDPKKDYDDDLHLNSVGETVLAEYIQEQLANKRPRKRSLRSGCDEFSDFANKPLFTELLSLCQTLA